ncbi:alpha/beta hydrolase-fold protein [Psychromicrobium sp. YIM B11713]|uniref:alpha/beta hydrolase-fold protein n=1 Tax=Psychromicrobium sp. YIM B11713 TaxID=3145233 RepID=UPI00374E65A7
MSLKPRSRRAMLIAGTGLSCILLCLSACTGTSDNTIDQDLANVPFLTSSDFHAQTNGIKVLGAQKVGQRTFDLQISTDSVDNQVTSQGNGFRVTLPVNYNTNQSYPVLYLFPGTSPDSSYQDWSEKGHIESIMGDRQEIAVMPDDGKAGWYSDWSDAAKPTQKWQSYHLDQLIPWVDGHLKTVAHRSGRTVVGASAGGYGAIHYAADRPELFSAAASLSGPLDLGLPEIRSLIQAESKDLTGNENAIFGDGKTTSEAQWDAHDPMKQCQALSGTKITLYAGEGTPGTDLDDPKQLEGQLFQSATDFGAVLSQCHNKFVNQIGKKLPDCDGGHNWDCWSAALRALLPRLSAATFPGG